MSYIVRPKQSSSSCAIKIWEEKNASNKTFKNLKKLSEEGFLSKENLNSENITNSNFNTQNTNECENIQPIHVFLPFKDYEKKFYDTKTTTIFHNPKNYLNNYKVSLKINFFYIFSLLIKTQLNMSN